MKGLFLKYMSALLAVWYCVSIVGFDVHSCDATGNTFVSSLLSGTACEDIHPEHDCDCHSSCCKSHKCDHEIPSSAEKEDDDCCSNEIEVLDSEGVQTQHEEYLEMNDCIVFQYNECVHCSRLHADAEYIVCLQPDSGGILEPDIQAVLNIWRI